MPIWEGVPEQRWRIAYLIVTASLAGLLLAALGRSANPTRFAGKIAFVAKKGETADLFVIRSDGQRRHQLTHDAREEGAPTWGPGGKSIAFVSTDFRLGGPSHGEAISTISVVTANGARRRGLFRTRAPQLALSDLAWSPDGRRIAFTWLRDGSYQLWLLRPERRTLASVTTAGQQASWAPDSRRLAFRGAGGIFVENVETRKTRGLTGAGDAACPVWSPNGRWIAICSASGTGNQFSVLEVITPAGTYSRELVKSKFVMPVAWSPKSDAILFLGANDNAASGRALFIVRLRDRHVTQVTGTEGAIGSASWYP